MEPTQRNPWLSGKSVCSIYVLNSDPVYRGMDVTLVGTSLTPIQSIQVSNVFTQAEILTIMYKQQTPPPDIPIEQDDAPSEAADGSADNPCLIDDDDRAQAGSSVAKSCRLDFHIIRQGLMGRLSSF